MSAVKIQILNNGKTVLVSVDGKAAYSTSNPAVIEEQNIKKLFELLVIENVKFELKFI